MRIFVAGLLLAACAQLLRADPISIPTGADARPRLKTIYAGEHQISDLKEEDSQALVLVFMGTECPVAQLYAPRLVELHHEFEDQGVKFYAVYANAGDHLLSMARHAQDSDFPFPVFLDWEHKLADLLGVEVTPEAVVLDANFQVRYRGAIDNQFKKRGRLQDAYEHYLQDALENLLAGTPIEPSFVPASGCPLERQEPLAASREVTYYKDIAPIIQQRCQTCHRPGGPGPFHLVDYADAYYNTEKIRETVLERRMPPWHGFLNPEFGELHNDARLSDEEIETLLGWIKQGAPEGDPNDAPQPVDWPRHDQWQIGKPDYVYKMPEPFRVPKTGVLEYQFFRVKLNLKEDRWFRAVEVKPGNPEVVHHIGLHIVPAGDEEFSGFIGMAMLYGFTTESAKLINDYVPGDSYNAKTYPAGQSVRIPKNSDLVYELHYTPNNREATTDQSMVAFLWADKPPAEEIHTEVFRKPVGRFRIPPHHSHYRMQDSYYFKQDVLIDAIRPHFHYRAKSFLLEVVKRDAETDEILKRKTVLSVPNWDPDWQRTYELKTPLKLPAGIELLATCHFDNSRFNPNNPDPSATVEWGQQTNDEMFSTRFKYRVISATDEEVATAKQE